VDSVPERYLRKAQYLDARANPEFIGELIEQITDGAATIRDSAVAVSGGESS